MIWIRKPIFFISLLTAISLILGGCVGLAGDITPPPNQPVSSQSQSTSTPSLNPTPTSAAGSSPVPTAELAAGTVAVQVQDQTGGALLDQGLEISLEGYDQFEQVYQAKLPVPADGQVVFEDVPFLTDRVFFASVVYGGAIYRSEIVQAAEDTDSLNLSLSIYETTTDPAGLIIDRLHVLVDFSQPGQAQVAEIYILSNLGQATIVAPSSGGASVEFSLPPGAASIQFEDGTLGQRFLLTERGFGDTVSIPPGAGVYQVLVSYILPYPNNRLSFEQVLDYPLSAAVVMVPAGQIRVKSGVLEDMGEQTLANGTVRIYASGALAQGDSLSFTISGDPTAAGGLESRTSSIQIGVIVAGVVGVLLLAAGAWLYFNNKRRLMEPAADYQVGKDREEIIDSILALEDLYEKGEISQEVFERKRVELKEQLRRTGDEAK